ncbi:MAG: Hpt domain-containing protein [Planctomycetota bacterium]
MTPSTEAQLVYSDFGDDPDLGELVEMFVDELPGRVSDLEEQASLQDWQAVCRGAHQLKGAGGSYGFASISSVGQVLESKCKSDAPEDEILQALADLAGLCGRVRSGVAQ